MSTPQPKKGLTNAALIDLVRGLPKRQKLLIAREFRREGLRVELDHLMAVFKTNELELSVVDQAVKAERTKAYARWRSSR